MTELLAFEHEDVLVVDSRLIAQRLGIQHRNFMATTNNYKKQMEQVFGAVLFETEPRVDANTGGDQPKYALLTENQATFLMTLSRNTREVVQCKLDLVQAFSKAKELLKQAEQDRSEWEAIKACVLPAPKKWAKMFPDEFWQKLETVTGKPQHVNAWLVTHLYARFPKGVHKTITQQNPRTANGHRSHKTHQFLSPGVGVSALELFKAQFIAVMDISPPNNYPRLVKNLKKVFSSTVQLELPMPDEPEEDAA